MPTSLYFPHSCPNNEKVTENHVLDEFEYIMSDNNEQRSLSSFSYKFIAVGSKKRAFLKGQIIFLIVIFGFYFVSS